jgi:uncharacterized Fe-S cluster protein YjdI
MTTKLVKLVKVPLIYPSIICFSSKHCVHGCPRKAKVQNMLWTKPNTTTIVSTKNPKLDNVPINVVVVITTCNQTP